MTNKLLRKYVSKKAFRTLGYALLITLPVVLFVFKFSIINRHGIFRGEDWDYFAQSYEAARQSILHYHQFPWWNPWMNGGQPLFANPQFGLFSLQMPLVLLFGTIAGLHYSVMVYYLLGFWGIYRLLQRLGSSNRLITGLLSYIWIFSGFAAWHLGGGQLTFGIYLLTPWAILSALNINKKRGWLWFGLISSLMILSAAHYLTIETLAVCGIIAVFQVGKQVYHRHLWTIKAIWPLLKPYVYAGGLIIVLCGIRLVYTLQFTHQYPRIEPLDPPESLKLLIASLTFRHPVDPAVISTTPLGTAPYGWTEYANYFGILTLGLFFYLVVRRFEKIKSVTLEEWTMLVAIGLAGMLTVGAFMSLSPFAILHHLPFFNQMRVPSRFICWFSLGIILFLAKVPKKPIIYILLAISAVDVFAAGYSILSYPQTPYKQVSNLSSSFEQYEFFQTDPSLGQIGIMNIQNLRLMRATQENYGEVYGYEPVLNTGEYYFLPGTSRCGINNGCSFVLTGNATVTSWSPQKISLKRTAPGPIKLNMNPGKVWHVNGAAPFASYKILEMQRDFVINDSSQTINVTYQPTL